MNIAVNARFLLKDKLEGIGRFTYEVTKRMVLNQPSDQFYFFFDRKFDDSFIFADNVHPVILYPQARHPFLYIVWFEYSVRKALVEYDIDVFLSTDGFLTLSTNVPTVLVVHDLAAIHFPEHITRIQRWYYKKFMPLFIKKAKRIIAVSKATKDDVIKTYGVEPSKIKVVYNACSFENPLLDFTKTEILLKYTNGNPYILYVGAIHPRKNVNNLIKAFDLVKKEIKEPLSLLIVGRKAWNIDSTEAAFEKSPNKKDIFFNPHISHEVLPTLYKNAEVFAYVSKFEGFGIPLLEAMQYDIPIVTSDVSSLPEVVGEAGLLANPEDVQGISNQLIKALLNEPIKKELKLNCAKEREKFSWDESAKSLFMYVSEIVD